MRGVTPSGKVMGPPNARLSEAERFEMKVDRSGECHRWTGSHDQHGYGRFWYGRRGKGAHVVALLMAGVDVPKGMTVDHVWARGCKYRDCVRVDHLEVVTYRENNLRGNNRAARNARMTHCPNGHEFAGYNLRIRPNGKRTCRECDNARARVRYANRRKDCAA